MAFTIKQNDNNELEVTTRNKLDVSNWNAEQKLQYLVDTDVFLNGKVTDELRKELNNSGYIINSDGIVEKAESTNEKKPVIFSITKEEEIRYYRNDEMSLNELIKRYSECENPFIELGETSQRIDTIQFAVLEQTFGTTSIEIVPDENRVTVYENKGNDVYENELGDGFEEYKLSELLNQLEKEPVESEKSTITVDEKDILQMSAKIQQNHSDDVRFAEQVDKFIEGKTQNYETLSLGATPNVLYLVGANANELTIKQNVLKNSMLDESLKLNGHFSGHNIPVETIKKLPDQIRNPILILQGHYPNTVVAVTELKNNDNNRIIVPIALDLKSVDNIVNKVSSIYGKDNINKYLSHHQDQILAYNKEKTDRLHKDIGLQLPKLNTAICFDNSIAYTTKNVKTPEQFLQQKIDKSESLLDKLQAEGKAVINDDGSFKVNNGYYRSLPREERVTEVIPVRHAAEIMQQLTNKGVEFSAVSRQNNKAAITVHIKDKDVLNESTKAAADKQIKEKQTEISKSGNKETINPDFYKNLAPADRHIQRITKADTDKVLSALESKGIEYSAVKSDKLTAVTVHKDNKAAIGQALLESNKAAAKEFINSDYYKSLPADQRLYSQTSDLKAAKDIMKSLDSADVKYSAVIDNERSTAKITIAKQDIQEAKKSGALFSRQSQRAFTSKAQAQNNERAAVKTAEHKKDDHSL